MLQLLFRAKLDLVSRSVSAGGCMHLADSEQRVSCRDLRTPSRRWPDLNGIAASLMQLVIEHNPRIDPAWPPLLFPFSVEKDPDSGSASH